MRQLLSHKRLISVLSMFLYGLQYQDLIPVDETARPLIILPWTTMMTMHMFRCESIVKRNNRQGLKKTMKAWKGVYTTNHFNQSI